MTRLRGRPAPKEIPRLQEMRALCEAEILRILQRFGDKPALSRKLGQKFAEGVWKARTLAVLDSLANSFGGDEAAAMNLGVERSTFTKWRNQARLTADVYEYALLKWGSKIQLPTLSEERTHGYIAAINAAQDYTERRVRRISPLEREEWEAFTRALSNPAWVGAQIRREREALLRISEQILDEVQALDGIKEQKIFRIVSGLMLEALIDLWRTPLLLVIGVMKRDFAEIANNADG